MRHTIRLLLAVLFGAFLFACGTNETEGPEATQILELQQVLDFPAGPALFDYRSQVLRLSNGSFVIGPLFDLTTFALFSPDGQLDKIVGSPGPGPGEFERIIAIAANDQDRILVLDWRGRTEVFDPTGIHLQTITLQANPRNIVALADTAFVVNSLGTSSPITLLDADGDVLRSIQSGVAGAFPIWSFVQVNEGFWGSSRDSRFRHYDGSGNLLAAFDPYIATDGESEYVKDIAADVRYLYALVSEVVATSIGPGNVEATGETRPQRLSVAEAKERYRYDLYTIDPADHSIVGSVHIPQAFIGGFVKGTSFIYGFLDNSAGEVEIRVWRPLMSP